MCDFETSTEMMQEEETWVWAVCTTDIQKALWDTPTNDLDYIHHSQFESWLNWVFQQEQQKIWFHNLKFDGQFITDWLLRHEYVYIPQKEIPRPQTFTCLISDNNWFSVTIYSDYEKVNGEVVIEKGKPVVKKYVIQDSLKKIPVSVNSMAKDYGLDVLKGEIDYNKYRPIGYELDDNEREYIEHDVGIVAKVMRLFLFEQHMDKLTMSSDALNNYKESLEKYAEVQAQKIFMQLYPQLSETEDTFVRKQYKGGWVYVNPLRKECDITKREYIGELSDSHILELKSLGFTNKQIEKAVIEVFDVNQLYPSRMYEEILPVGRGIYFYDKYIQDDDYFLYVQRFRCRYKLKPNKYPMIQRQSGRFTGIQVYAEESIGVEELTLTSVDLELFFECYDVEDIDYIDGYKYRGATNLFTAYIDYWQEIKKNQKGAKRQIAKLMLNSLYGKFGTSRTAQIKIPMYDKEKDDVYYKSVPEVKKAVYVPMASFITSYARRVTVRAANACGTNFLYADTDSIHILIDRDLPKIEIDQKKLGAWKLENLACRGRYIRAKSYLEDMINEDGQTEIEVKCCGLSDTAKKYVTWENFHSGLIVQNVNLKQKKIKGGTILKETNFKIRDIEKEKMEKEEKKKAREEKKNFQ